MTYLQFGLLLATIHTLGFVSAQDVVFRQFDPPNEISSLTAAVDAWNQNNSDAQVQLESISSNDALNTYVREAQAGGGPDVVQLGFAWLPELIGSNLILNLDSLISSSPLGQGTGDFLASDLATANGSIYAVPWTADTFTMAYRPDALRAANIENFPDTWEALQSAVATLTVDTDGDGRTDQYGICFSAGSGLNSSTWFLANYYFWSNGDSLVTQMADGSWAPGISSDDLAGAMAYLNSFFENRQIPRSMVALTSFSDPELTSGLARGDCAITFFPPQTFRVAEEMSDADLMTAAIPKGSKTRVSHLGGRALAINPNSEQAENAYAFIQYLISADIMATIPQYPAQQSLLDKLSFPENESGFVEMLPEAVTFKRYTDSPAPLPGLAEATTREFASVFSGQKSSESAANDLLAAIEDLLNNSN